MDDSKFDDNVPERTQFETDVYEYINEARAEPDILIAALEERLKKFIDGTKKLQRNPTTFVTTIEGKEAVLDAIEYIKKRVKDKAVAEDLIWSDECFNVVKKHTEASTQTKTEDTSLISRDLHQEFTKLFEMEFEGDEQVGGHAECHDYGSIEPAEVILSLIVDDGNPTRNNRESLFGNWDYIGVSSKEHPVYKRMTSIVFVVSKETTDKELDFALKEAEEKLGVNDNTKYDWKKKGANVRMNGEGQIVVKFSLELQNGKKVELEYEYQSKY